MIYLTGGSGLLGSELQKYLNCFSPSHQEQDILYAPRVPRETSMIVHCAAYTDVEKAEQENGLCYAVNVEGTVNLARLNIPMVYISTEYVFDGKKGNYSETDETNPVNFYAKTKLWGEYASRDTQSLRLRVLFKPSPWKYPKAFVDQWTSGDYVEAIAPIIAKVILEYPERHDVLNIGTGKKSIYTLARETREVEEICRSDVGVNLPRDTSLNLDKLKEFINEY